MAAAVPAGNNGQYGGIHVATGPSCNCAPRVSLEAGSPATGSQTESNVMKFRFTWRIVGFSCLLEEKGKGELLQSATFYAGPKKELEWVLRIYREKAEDECLSVFLVLRSNSKRCDILTQYEISILNALGQRTISKYDYSASKYSVRSDRATWKMGFPRFVPEKIILDEANELLPDDTLTILCEAVTSFDRASGLAVQLQYNRTILSEDLSSLFENQKFSDVTLCVGDKELLAHKAILVARSPVFAAMFQPGMEESEQNRVVITDLKYEVLKEMLVYIYTGKSENMKSMTIDLLAAAIKYNLGELRKACEALLPLELSCRECCRFLSIH